MRRLLLPFCAAVLVAAALAVDPTTPPETASATQTASTPFPPLWALQAAPDAASAATSTIAAGRARAEGEWYALAVWNDTLAAQAEWYAAASRPPPARPAPSSPRPARSASVASSGRCGGNLPPCSVMACESGGSLTARNGSGAAGKWQIMPGTWAGYGGYSSADRAPEVVQDERAAQIYAGGAGRSQWSC